MRTQRVGVLGGQRGGIQRAAVSEKNQRPDGSSGYCISHYFIKGC